LNSGHNEYNILVTSRIAVIWLDVGNAGTVAIAELLGRERQRIHDFEKQEETSLLILSIGPTAI